MATHRHSSGEEQRLAEGVAASLGTAYWSVAASRWPLLRPNLPPHLVDLLAPPIVVGAAPVDRRRDHPTPAG